MMRVVSKRQGNIKQVQGGSSSVINKRPPTGQKVYGNDEDHVKSAKKFINESNSKTQLNIQNSKKIIPPLTGKNQTSGRGQQMKFISNQEDYSMSNIQTINHHYASGMLSNTESDRVKTAEYPTQVYENKSVIVGAQNNFPQNEASSQNNESLSQTAFIQNPKKVFEDGSNKYVNSNFHADGTSHFSIPSDSQSHQLNFNQSALVSQKQSQGKIQLNPNQPLSQSNNKLTFRNENQNLENQRNLYQLPLDDSKQNQNDQNINLPQFSNQVKIDEAQIDMQNFQVLDKRIEGTSVDSSREQSNSKIAHQDYSNGTTSPYNQNQFKFAMNQKLSSIESQDQQKERYAELRDDQNEDNKQSVRKHDLQNFHDTESQQQDDDYEEDQDNLQQQDEENEDYQDDNNMPYSDGEQQQEQFQNNINRGDGELLFTNNQHIFKNQQDSDDENFDHKNFMPTMQPYQQQLEGNGQFMLPQDDEEENEINNIPSHPIMHQDQNSKAFKQNQIESQAQIKPQKQKLDNLNDDVIFNRLPKNFFAKEDVEVKDTNKVLNSITQLRKDFLGYVNENNIHQKLEEISNIIQPEKFIQKHFGDEDPTQILFEKVISPQNIKTSSDQIIDDKDISVIKQKKHNVNETESQKQTIIEEENESSPDNKKKRRIESQNQSPTLNKVILKAAQNRSNKESARQLKIKSAKNIIKPPDSSMYTVGQTMPNQGPRHIKMADYFKDQSSSKHNDLTQNDLMSEGEDKNKLSKIDLHNNQEDDLISLNDLEKENLKQKMEQDILQNIDINFLFNKGDQLRFGLIDQHKAYKLMMKIKEVANQQVEKGSKQIDYNEIVKFLDEEELYEDEQRRKLIEDMEVHPISEPMKSRVPQKEPFTQEMWTQVVDFMRKNPKILMQMLPDEEEAEILNEYNQTKGKNKVMQQIEEAKRWAKLQSLSKNFMQKRDLLEAIDNQQNVRVASPPKAIIIKDKKNNYKSIAKQKQKADPKNDIPKSPKPNLQQDLNSGSDTDNQQQKTIQSRTFQKQFQYNSVSTAKNIYSNPAFLHPDVNQQSQQTPIGNQQNQIQLNSNRPVQSQQQPRVKSQNNGKKGSIMSTMGDITTLGTTTTGLVTNLNNYRINNLPGSQNHTIEDSSYPPGSQLGGQMSMLQNYNQNEIINGAGGNSQRRPITASAAHQNNNNRSLGFMKPILQQKLESFDMTTNKSGKYSRGGSISKNSYAKRNIQLGDYSDAGNNSAIINYNSQPGQIDVLSGYNNLNQSFGGGSIVGQKFAPIHLGPSKNTQKYIQKIAPNLKENDMYPKILNKPRGASLSREMPILNPRRILSNEYVSNSQQINSLNKRTFGENQRRSEALNLSTTNMSVKNQELNDSAQEQTPQGTFPKFVKPNALNRSNYLRKESNNDIESQNSQILSQSKKFANPKNYKDQNMQTRIGGVNNKLLISPQTGLTDPFQNDDLSQPSRQDSQVSDKFSKKHLKVPIVDWAYTSLVQKILKQDTEFNKEQDMSIYLEKEVDYVIDMMKNKYKDFKRSEIMRPFYLKSLQTAQALLVEQGLQSVFEKMSKKYKEITIENTMKLLIRCKLAFHSRGMLIDILQMLINYELKAVEMKQIIDKHSKYRIPQSEYEEIQTTSQALFDYGHDLLVKIQTLRSVHKQFKTPFIFKKKDYVNYVRSEMNEIKKLISIFKVSMIGGPTEQDDLNKYLNIDAESHNSKSDHNLLNKIEENKNETEEQSYYSTENNNQYQ